MPINRLPGGGFQFEFSRLIGSTRVRVKKNLPKAWSRGQADAYDRKESARLYAEATGLERPRFTIDQAVARYVDERAVELKSGRGIMAELASMLPWYEGRPLESLPEVCAEFTKEHRATLAPATIMNKLRYLVSACRWGWKRGMGEHDPGARVVMPAVSNKRHVYIDRAEMLLLCQHTYDKPSRAAIRIAFYSGMRRGEILRAAQADGTFVLEDTKNGERRIVDIHPRVRCCARYAWPSKYALGYWFRKARYQIARPDLHFHDLRHSAASEMLNQGVPLYTVGAVLGHKSQASTARYAHLARELTAEAIGKIGRRA